MAYANKFTVEFLTKPPRAGAPIQA